MLCEVAKGSDVVIRYIGVLGVALVFSHLRQTLLNTTDPIVKQFVLFLEL
jgi:hypothetical protein